MKRDDQNCKNCYYSHSDSCRIRKPEIETLGSINWPPVKDNDWCFGWKDRNENCTDSIKGIGLSTFFKCNSCEKPCFLTVVGDEGIPSYCPFSVLGHPGWVEQEDTK